MPGEYPKVVCLANSRKLSGHCFAGKIVSQENFGKWVRPVSRDEHGVIHWETIRCKGRHCPDLLDVLSIPLVRNAPQDYQSENFDIDLFQPWQFIGQLSTNFLGKIADKCDVLWINGHGSSKGKNDRIPEKLAKDAIFNSLALIKPETLAFYAPSSNGSRQVRAAFRYLNAEYDLAVTDPKIEKNILSKNAGCYPVPIEDIYLCVSLGVPFEGYVYKLVAGVVNCPMIK